MACLNVGKSLCLIVFALSSRSCSRTALPFLRIILATTTVTIKAMTAGIKSAIIT